MKKSLLLIIGAILLLSTSCAGGKKSSAAEAYLEGSSAYDNIGVGYSDNYGSAYSDYDKYFTSKDKDKSKSIDSYLQDPYTDTEFKGSKHGTSYIDEYGKSSKSSNKGSKSKKKNTAVYDDYDFYTLDDPFGDMDLSTEDADNNKRFKEMVKKTQEYGKYNKKFQVRDNSQGRMKKIRARDSKLFR